MVPAPSLHTSMFLLLRYGRVPARSRHAEDALKCAEDGLVIEARIEAADCDGGYPLVTHADREGAACGHLLGHVCPQLSDRAVDGCLQLRPRSRMMRFQGRVALTVGKE